MQEILIARRTVHCGLRIWHMPGMCLCTTLHLEAPPVIQTCMPWTQQTSHRVCEIKSKYTMTRSWISRLRRPSMRFGSVSMMSPLPQVRTTGQPPEHWPFWASHPLTICFSWQWRKTSAAYRDCVLREVPDRKFIRHACLLSLGRLSYLWFCFVMHRRRFDTTSKLQISCY